MRVHNKSCDIFVKLQINTHDVSTQGRSPKIKILIIVHHIYKGALDQIPENRTVKKKNLNRVI